MFQKSLGGGGVKAPSSPNRVRLEALLRSISIHKIVLNLIRNGPFGRATVNLNNGQGVFECDDTSQRKCLNFSDLEDGAARFSVWWYSSFTPEGSSNPPRQNKCYRHEIFKR